MLFRSLSTKIDQLLKPQNQHVLVERSIMAQKKIFIPLLFKENKISVLEKDLLDHMIDNVLKMRQLNPTIYIYLKTSIVTAKRRIDFRARTEERQVSTEYLYDIDDRYNQWLDPNKMENLIIVDNDHDHLNIQDLIDSLRLKLALFQDD